MRATNIIGIMRAGWIMHGIGRPYLVNGAKEEDEHRRDHASHDSSDYHQKLGEILSHPSSRLLDPSSV